MVEIADIPTEIYFRMPLTPFSKLPYVKDCHRFQRPARAAGFCVFCQIIIYIILMLAGFFIGEIRALPQLIHHSPLGAP
jgi:hypothetical protein